MSDELPEPDRTGDLPHPRHVYDLFGQDEAARAAEGAFASGRMHHAWMITGPKGCGKATLAWRLARRVLGAAPSQHGAPLASDPNDPVCRKLEARSHPGMLLIRRPWNDKTKKLRGEITVDEARRAPDFFSRSASDGGWRVAIVDSADELNTNAANALLKTLEEPPKRGLLLLIVHSPGRLLPTIRSRCRRLSLRAPDVEACAGWLQESHGVAANEAQGAAALAAGAPGRALALLETGAPALKTSLDQALGELPRLDKAAVMKLADAAGRKDGDALKAIVLDFLGDFAREQARAAALGEVGAVRARPWVEAADRLNRLARDSESLYLDPKQTIHAAFALLQDVAAA
jgi:DNA polymerase-3 subunit delta'